MLALLNRPRLVILDELTQGLDPAARREVWAAVRQLHDAGTTVLLVTHEMDEAEALCDRVVVMRAGRVLDAGTPAELVDRYARTATVRFALPARPSAGGHGRAGGGCWTSSGSSTACGSWQRTAPESPWTATAASSRTSAPAWCATAWCPTTWACTCPSLEDAMLTLLEPGPDDPGRTRAAMTAHGELSEDGDEHPWDGSSGPS